MISKEELKEKTSALKTKKQLLNVFVKGKLNKPLVATFSLIVARSSVNKTEIPCFLLTKSKVKEQNPTVEELTLWYQKSGLPLKKFFNTSGLVYKSLALKDKLPTMTEEEQLALLATDGMLVKRPIVVTEDAVLVGFKESEWSEKL